LTGKEQFNIDIREGNLQVHEELNVTTNTGKSFKVKVRLDTDVEIEYFKNGGILHYVLRRLAKA
jgi:aconitate hydratase